MDATDEQLVERCRKELPYGTLAYEELVRRYEPVVFSTCLRYLSNRQDAEEVSQDCFLRVFHALPKFEGKSAFRTWLFRIVTNQCATRFAKLKKQQQQYDELKTRTVNEGIARHQPQPTQFDAQFSGPLGQAMDELTDSDRQILILRHVADLSLQEIADALELKLSAAKMRLTRSQQRLKEKYDGLTRET